MSRIILNDDIDINITDNITIHILSNSDNNGILDKLQQDNKWVKYKNFLSSYMSGLLGNEYFIEAMFPDVDLNDVDLNCIAGGKLSGESLPVPNKGGVGDQRRPLYMNTGLYSSVIRTFIYAKLNRKEDDSYDLIFCTKPRNIPELDCIKKIDDILLYRRIINFKNLDEGIFHADEIIGHVKPERLNIGYTGLNEGQQAEKLADDISYSLKELKRNPKLAIPVPFNDQRLCETIQGLGDEHNNKRGDELIWLAQFYIPLFERKSPHRLWGVLPVLCRKPNMYDKQKIQKQEPTFDESNLNLYANCVYDCGGTILTPEMAKLDSIFSFGGNLNALYQLWGYNGILLKGKVTEIHDGKIYISGNHDIPYYLLNDAKRPEIGNQVSFTLKNRTFVDKNDFNIINNEESVVEE